MEKAVCSDLMVSSVVIIKPTVWPRGLLCPGCIVSGLDSTGDPDRPDVKGIGDTSLPVVVSTHRVGSFAEASGFWRA